MYTKEEKLFRDLCDSSTETKSISQIIKKEKFYNWRYKRWACTELKRLVATADKTAEASIVSLLSNSLTEHKPDTHQVQAPFSKLFHEHEPR